MRVVGLVGPKRSGKSTAAEALVRERGFVSIGFADALKDLALRVNPLIHDYPDDWRVSDVVNEHGWERAKDQYPEVRRILQELGTGVRDIVSERGWTQTWARAFLRACQNGAPGVVVPDVRFVNEAACFQDRHDTDVLLIRVARPGLDASDTHVSETEQLGIECDMTIHNVRTPEWLSERVVSTVDTWMAGASL